MEEAQQAPGVSTTFSVFLNGKFITHEILTKDKFKQLVL
ncbi:MAG: YoaP domain-containing protein [Bacillota bacterium]